MRPAKHLQRVISANGAVVAENITDLDEFVELLTPFTRPHRIIPRDRRPVLDAHLQAVAGTHVAYAKVFYGAHVHVVPDEVDTENFLIPISLSGSGRLVYGSDTIFISGAESTMIAPYRESRSEMAADYDQIIVSIERPRLELIAGRLLAQDGPRQLQLKLSAFEPTPALIALLEASLTAALPESGLSEISARLDDLVIESLLLSMPSFRDRLPHARSAGAHRVARAVHYMMDNLAEPLTITEIARHVGVTPRALQIAFRDSINEPPIVRLRNLRLDRAHTMLTEPGGEFRRVADVAHQCGFHHMGEFAAAFRARFGESPSVVHRRTHKAAAEVVGGEVSADGA